MERQKKILIFVSFLQIALTACHFTISDEKKKDDSPDFAATLLAGKVNKNPFELKKAFGFPSTRTDKRSDEIFTLVLTDDDKLGDCTLPTGPNFIAINFPRQTGQWEISRPEADIKFFSETLKGQDKNYKFGHGSLAVDKIEEDHFEGRLRARHDENHEVDGTFTAKRCKELVAGLGTLDNPDKKDQSTVSNDPKPVVSDNPFARPTEIPTPSYLIDELPDMKSVVGVYQNKKSEWYLVAPSCSVGSQGVTNVYKWEEDSKEFDDWQTSSSYDWYQKAGLIDMGSTYGVIRKVEPSEVTNGIVKEAHAVVELATEKLLPLLKSRNVCVDFDLDAFSSQRNSEWSRLRPLIQTLTEIKSDFLKLVDKAFIEAIKIEVSNPDNESPPTFITVIDRTFHLRIGEKYTPDALKVAVAAELAKP